MYGRARGGLWPTIRGGLRAVAKSKRTDSFCASSWKSRVEFFSRQLVPFSPTGLVRSTAGISSELISRTKSVWPPLLSPAEALKASRRMASSLWAPSLTVISLRFHTSHLSTLFIGASVLIAPGCSAPWSQGTCCSSGPGPHAFTRWSLLP